MLGGGGILIKGGPTLGFRKLHKYYDGGVGSTWNY